MKFVNLKRLAKHVSPHVRYILILFICTRLILGVIGVLTRQWVGQVQLNGEISNAQSTNYNDNLWLDNWGHWDSDWYLQIAENGYSTEKNIEQQANYAFFPLFPHAARVAGVLFGGNPYLGGLLVSNVSLLVAAVYLYKLIRLKYDRQTGRRAIKYLFLFPVGFVFSGFLTEGLFLALAISSFYYAEKNQWLVAGLLGGALALTRPVGVFIFLPLLYLYLAQRQFKLKKSEPNILWLLLVPAGLAIVMLINYQLTGNALAFIDAVKVGWGFDRTPGSLLVIFDGILHESRIQFLAAFSLISIGLLLFKAREIGMAYALFGLLLIGIPLSTGLYGAPRYTAVAFPLYIIAARFSAKASVDQLVTIGLVLLQGFLMTLWSMNAVIMQ